MKNIRSSIALAVAALFVAYGAQAQTAASPTREQVKQEAIQANKAGTTVTGECSGDQKADAGACKKAPVTSTKTSICPLRVNIVGSSVTTGFLALTAASNWAFRTWTTRLAIGTNWRLTSR